MVDLMIYEKLTQFLQQKLPAQYRNNLYSWIASGTLINQGAQVTADQVEVAHIKYTATLLFSEFPYRHISAVWLMALIQQWLNQNDEMRCQLDFSETTFDVDLYDDDTADITFNVEFQEPITARKDESGNIDINGEKYRIEKISINYAEEIDVVVKQ
ncbi:phage tail protein [Pasteurellaceae bacterium HPA106]|uniref:phage tail protein n=1 Tax=Spirabiliibacterium pneumoniae TaxID=221400 RepID=UPI001AADB80F|nr:phage tail protein [Spirabiliibacterium pneumoniae]MBE2895575.1 phage tail protein [Spirabiliibacterium pneumoniae]